MAKSFLHLLCLTYGALCGLFATRLVLNRLARAAKNEPTPRRMAPDGFAQQAPSANWMHRRRPGLGPGSSLSRDNRIH